MDEQILTQVKALAYYGKLLIWPYGLNVEHQFSVSIGLMGRYSCLCWPCLPLHWFYSVSTEDACVYYCFPVFGGYCLCYPFLSCPSMCWSMSAACICRLRLFASGWLFFWNGPLCAGLPCRSGWYHGDLCAVDVSAQCGLEKRLYALGRCVGKGASNASGSSLYGQCPQRRRI